MGQQRKSKIYVGASEPEKANEKPKPVEWPLLKWISPMKTVKQLCAGGGKK